MVHGEGGIPVKAYPSFAKAYTHTHTNTHTTRGFSFNTGFLPRQQNKGPSPQTKEGLQGSRERERQREGGREGKKEKKETNK